MEEKEKRSVEIATEKEEIVIDERREIERREREERIEKKEKEIRKKGRGDDEESEKNGRVRE